MRAQEPLARTACLLSRIRIIPFDETAAARFKQLRQRRGLRKIGRADGLIARITFAHHATLVTRKVRHFRQIPGLTVVNWVN